MGFVEFLSGALGLIIAPIDHDDFFPASLWLVLGHFRPWRVGLLRVSPVHRGGLEGRHGVVGLAHKGLFHLDHIQNLVLRVEIELILNVKKVHLGHHGWLLGFLGFPSRFEFLLTLRRVWLEIVDRGEGNVGKRGLLHAWLAHRLVVIVLHWL